MLKYSKTIRYSVFAVFIAIGSILYFAGSSGNFLKPAGIFAIVFGTFVFQRLGKAQYRANILGSKGKKLNISTVAISLSVLVAFLDIFSLWLLHYDAINGHKAIFPVYLFAGCGLLSVGVWSYALAIMVRNR